MQTFSATPNNNNNFVNHSQAGLIQAYIWTEFIFRKFRVFRVFPKLIYDIIYIIYFSLASLHLSFFARFHIDLCEELMNLNY